MAVRTNTVRPHSAPGLYFKEEVQTYANKSIGITTLGVAGETLRGPAFQPIPIKNWREFQTYFGGTSTAKYKGSQYPRYELPYIAKSYLEQSDQLEVVRVLGLSGVNAGPAWIITATKHKLYNGYDYVQIPNDPGGIDWGTECSYSDIALVPTVPNITDEDCDYIRVFDHYEWRTVCANCDITRLVDPEQEFDLTDPDHSTIPDANDPDYTYDYIRVFQGCKYDRVATPAQESDRNTYWYSSVVITPTQNGVPKFRYPITSGKLALGIIRFKNSQNNSDYCDVSCDIFKLVMSSYSSSVPRSFYDAEIKVTSISGTWNPGFVVGGRYKTSFAIQSDGQPHGWTNTSTSGCYVYDLSTSAQIPNCYLNDPGTFTYDENFEYEYFELNCDSYCYEKTEVYKYFHKEKRTGIQLSDEDDSADNKNNIVVGVIRSRGEHKKAAFVRTPTESDIANGICEDIYKRDGIEYYTKSLCLEPSKSLTLDSSCNPGFSTTTGDFTIDNYNYGTFTFVVGTSDGETKRYSVSLNPGDKNYIYNVIGGTPDDGDAEIFVEELYDVALRQLVENGSINAINSELLEYPAVNIVPKFEDANDILVDSALNRTYRGKRYLYSSSLSSGITVRYSLDDGKTWIEGNGVNGVIYTVFEKTDPVTGKKFYFYGAYVKDLVSEYQAMDQCPSITWYDCDDAITGVKQNYFDEAPYFFTQPVVENPAVININGTCYKKVVVDVVDDNDGKRRTERLTEYDFCNNVIDGMFTNCVNVLADGLTYVYTNNDVYPITLDFNNYREQYRYASTPWIVSEVKGSAEQVELNKLFRFHTISDGNNSSFEVKISIENIDPSTGKFDVVIRSFNDSDYNPNVLERYVGCTLVPGDPDYISLKIGSFDELYNSVSNYVTVEVVENDVTKLSIPAGFLGYPVRDYSGIGINKSFKYVEYFHEIPAGAVEMDEVPCHATCDDPEYIEVDGKAYEKVIQSLTTDPKQPYFKFNTTVDSDVKIKKQYFGVSDLVGIDTDIFSYKGVEAYNGVPSGLTPCFHLDARIINGTPNANGEVTDGSVTQVVSVDGVTGYTWSTVNKNITTSEGIEPRIGSEEVMTGTIYEDKKYRKFTVAFYGGWDGWDYYRTSRSTSNEFRYKDYKGFINSTSGYGEMFNILKNPDAFDFDTTDKIITSDYYAFLAGARQFNNPKSIEINVLATPGIDYVNNGHLVNEIIDMVEEERADCVYIVTTPDKPFGASDAKDEMYTAEEAVANLEDSDIDSNHTASYYPWVKYFDVDNSEYIYLPVTRDVVKSIALTDNQAFPWYAAAGWNRGNISGVAPKRKLKQGEQDTLYDGRLNFVASFAQEGDKIWGDKDLQILDNQLNRLSARRLLLRIKRMLKTSCIGLLFDPNDANASKAVRSAVSSVLDYVKDNRGISDYRIEIDDSASVRDQMGLGVTYYLRRNPMLEWISFTSVLTPQGMEW